MLWASEEPSSGIRMRSGCVSNLQNPVLEDASPGMTKNLQNPPLPPSAPPLFKLQLATLREIDLKHGLHLGSDLRVHDDGREFEVSEEGEVVDVVGPYRDPVAVDERRFGMHHRPRPLEETDARLEVATERPLRRIQRRRDVASGGNEHPTWIP